MKINIQVPVILIAFKKKFVSQLSVFYPGTSISKYLAFSKLYYQIAEKIPVIMQIVICITKMSRICLLVSFSIEDILYFTLLEFCMILVYKPAYTTRPRTHSVFLNELPLRHMFSEFNGIFLCCSSRKYVPSNL